MEELIAAIAAKTGLPADKASTAADAAFDLIKSKVPAPIGGQLAGFPSGNAAKAGDMIGDMTDKLKGMFGS